MLRRPSTATAIALLALVVALSGTAVADPVVNAAARLVTGKTVKNGSLTGRDVKDKSLTGKDVKNRSLTQSDFRGSVRGPRGATGATGPTGPTGPQGVSGVTSVLRLDVLTGSVSDPALDVDPILVSEAGAFTKGAAGSRIKLTWDGSIRGEGADPWFCHFQLGVDGAPPAGEGGGAAVFANGESESETSVSVTAFFEGLAPGTHEVGVYVRADPAATECATAERGFAEEILVEEMPG